MIDTWVGFERSKPWSRGEEFPPGHGTVRADTWRQARELLMRLLKLDAEHIRVVRYEV